MRSEDFKKSPKVFCESITIGYTKEFLAVSMNSGAEGTMYALSPAHAKRLYLYLAHQLNQYEKEYGAIDATWSPNIISPVQRANPPTDLS